MILKHANLYFNFILILLLGKNMYANEPELPIYLRYVNEITNSFAKEMEQELDLICIGSGGSMPYNVREISVKFISYRKGTVEQARTLVVKGTEKLLKKINEHEKIRPFLKEYPFKANGAEVSISFREKNNSSSDGSVAYAFHVKDKIFYDAEDALSHNYFKIFEEPYEDALKIVQGKISGSDEANQK